MLSVLLNKTFPFFLFIIIENILFATVICSVCIKVRFKCIAVNNQENIDNFKFLNDFILAVQIKKLINI